MVAPNAPLDRFGELAAQAFERSLTSGRDAGAVLGAGDLVLVQAPQFAGATELFWLTMAAGAVLVPCDPEWPAYLLEKAAGGLSPRLVVAAPEKLDALSRLFPHATALTADDDVARRIAIDADRAGAMAAESPAAYLFTSGSTDTPKTVCLSRAALAHSAALTVETFGWQAGERLFNLPELHSMSGLRNALVAAPMAGLHWAPSPAAERSDIFALLERIGESRCDHLVAGPSLVRQLAMVARRMPRDALAGVRAIYCTGAALPRDAVATVHAHFGTPVVNYYGLTETGGLCLSQNRATWSVDDASLGRPVGCRARLIGPDGREGAEGELQISSPQLMTGYVGAPDATHARFAEGWLRTGDIMVRDAAGAYHLRGREGLFIKTQSTDRIHPEEIEAVLAEHAAVVDAALVGVPDANGGERLVALVVPDPSAAADLAFQADLAMFAEQRLGRHRRPQQIEFVEKLPRNPVGKLIRAELRGMVS